MACPVGPLSRSVSTARVSRVRLSMAAPEPPFDEECNYEDRTPTTSKEKVVVLGSGWASVKFLQNIDTEKFDVTVVSPRNFFLFTPFLPSCVVGTVESRSIVEPIRKLLRHGARPITRKLRDATAGVIAENFSEARFLEAACTKIDPEQNCVFCQDISSVSGPCDAFRLDYDRLVVAVGATSNTFNTPGVAEHALFLKELGDASALRDRMLDAFESAALQDDPAEKTKLCTFVVVGAGPTGVEFAAELDDHIREDLASLYPAEVAASKVVLISSTDDLLSSYDKKISDFTKLVLDQSRVEVRSGVRVVEVRKDAVVCLDKKTKEEFIEPSFLTLWSTGVKPGLLVQELLAKIPEQTKRSGMLVDTSLLSYGSKNIYAAGDCAVLYTGNAMNEDLEVLFKRADADGNGALDKKELLALFNEVGDDYPQAEVFQFKIDEDFDTFDVDGSGTIELEEFKALLRTIDSSLRNLPPTAQVAGQMGGFLASRFNGETKKGFKYFHKGSMAYVGQEKAAAQVSMLKNLLPEMLQEQLPLVGEDIILTGGLAETVWRLLYLDMQISNRNKLQVGFDWTKAIIFGRDTSRF